MKGEVEEIRTGNEAADGRYMFEHQTTADRRKILERFLGHMMGNSQLDSVDADNLEDIDKDLIIRYKFTAEHYAKSTGGLLLVRPRVVGEKLGSLDMTKLRHYSYEFEVPTLQTDAFEFNLPDGYKIDELPDAAKANFAFGEYTSEIENTRQPVKVQPGIQDQCRAHSCGRDRRSWVSFFTRSIRTRNMAVLKKGN